MHHLEDGADVADHCIEILRQIIMCNSDTGLVPYHCESHCSFSSIILLD